MRSIFGQYASPENRLTHALVSSLDKDRKLLRAFVFWVTQRRIYPRRAEVTEQGFPDDTIEMAEEDAERRGIPDGCISDGTGWALLLESKFAAGVQFDQLRRHLRTAIRHGIDKPTLLLITVDRYGGHVPAGVQVKQWREIYAWLQRWVQRSQWARWCCEYFEVAEAKEAQSGYLREGTLTVFTGIPFGSEPYSYEQAKRLLGLLRGELIKDRRLAARLGADLKGKGRGAIKGRKSDLVWDYIPLRVARGTDSFTKFPHLTFSIHVDRVEAYVTIPNGVHRHIRWGAVGRDYSEFSELISTVSKNATSLVRVGATPMIAAVQRHYPSQSSPPVVDATLRVDLRTAFPNRVGDGKAVKHQPEWVRAVFDTLRHQKSNIQLQLGVEFRYNKASVCATPRIARAVADAWIACRPLLSKVL